MADSAGAGDAGESQPDGSQPDGDGDPVRRPVGRAWKYILEHPLWSAVLTAVVLAVGGTGVQLLRATISSDEGATTLDDIRHAEARAGSTIRVRGPVRLRERDAYVVVVDHQRSNEQGTGPSTDEVRIYERGGNGLALRFRFRPRARSSIVSQFTIQAIADLEENGARLIVGHYAVDDAVVNGVIPILIGWDAKQMRYRAWPILRGDNFGIPYPQKLARGATRKSREIRKIVEPFYARQFRMKDRFSDVTVVSGAVDAFAICHESLLDYLVAGSDLIDGYQVDVYAVSLREYGEQGTIHQHIAGPWLYDDVGVASGEAGSVSPRWLVSLWRQAEPGTRCHG